MSNLFKIKVNTNFEFDISEKDISKLDIMEINLASHHVLQKNKPFTTTVLASNFREKTYKVKVKDNVYDVSISNALDTFINDMGFLVGAAKKINFINAPMPGLILDVLVEIGQVVKQDDPLLILEAMKMESTIKSPSEGVVKSIAIKKEDTVDKGDLLIEFA